MFSPKIIGFITDKHVEACKKRAVGSSKGRIMKISQKLFLGFFTIVSLVVIVGSICILRKVAFHVLECQMANAHKPNVVFCRIV